MRDVFSEPNEPRRPISGTTAILCDDFEACDDVNVDVDVELRTRSVDWRLDGGFSSSSLDADERVLRDLLLLWRSRSRSLSLSLVRGVLRSRSGSFLLRRRCESDMVRRRRGSPRWCYCGPRSRQASAGGITSAAMGSVDWASRAGTSRGCAYQDSSSPSIYINQGRVR
jgi:hypothetical protein